MIDTNKSLFITLEGGEGTGKSTLTKSLIRDLVHGGNSVIATREPGGTVGAEEIRELLIKGSGDRWSAASEICLYYAAREDHIRRVIAPALAKGTIVICDRFFDSTRAYQGTLGIKESNIIKCLEENIVGYCMPDLTLVLDIDVEIGLRRAGARNDNENRFEQKAIQFHQNLRSKFLEIAHNEPQRCKIIDAALPIEQVHAQALGHINTALKDRYER